jgi:hypothetical protein
MAYIISRDNLDRWGNGASELELPAFLVLSRSGKESFRLEPLAEWLSRQRKRRAPELSTPRPKKRGSSTGQR